MTVSTNLDSHTEIPAAAEKALRRATGRTLTSFAILRKVLREHVEGARKQNSLEEIEIQLRAIVAGVRQETRNVPVDAGVQDNLSEHLIEWTNTFFRAPRDHG